MNEEIKEYTLKFHNTYERLAPNYGYETRKDTKEFNFNSNNGKLMYATVSEIISPLLQKLEQLEKENEQLRTQVNAYENHDDLTLFYMWLDEKAKDKIKQLENIRKEAIKYIEKEIKDMPLNGCKQRLTNLLNILNKGGISKYECRNKRNVMENKKTKHL